MKSSHIASLQTIGLILFSILILFFYSCEPEIVTKIDIPEEDPKLSVSAYLIPSDTIHQIYIGKSKPHNVPTDESWEVENAVATISDGSTTVTLTKAGLGYYQFSQDDLEIVPGKKYQFSAYAPGFKQSVHSSCVVPALFDPKLEVTSIDTVTTSEMTSWAVNFKIMDNPGTVDFYRIVGTMEFIDTTTFEIIHMPMSPAQPRFSMFDDAGRDGAWIPLRFDGYNYEWMGQGSGLKLVSINIDVLRTDEPYYKFHYPFVVKQYYPDDNPFTEPVIIFSNITNGYGVFCSAVKKSYRFQQ
ncbi:MAG TPA: DUF4249 domain-containing protein [Bacteroidales bacterium]|nr:DUF4249 domain-containing protein [Bacteroidales bacterium]HRZ49881.1 DUF4249 domain-containing protein [Bacteroidales bacterium]